MNESKSGLRSFLAKGARASRVTSVHRDFCLHGTAPTFTARRRRPESECGACEDRLDIPRMY